MLSTELAALYTRDLGRLQQELRAFPDTRALWEVAPGVSNAAGTLALHLEGNLREYIGRQLGHLEYTRDRPRIQRQRCPQEELVDRVEELRETIPRSDPRARARSARRRRIQSHTTAPRSRPSSSCYTC